MATTGVEAAAQAAVNLSNTGESSQPLMADIAKFEQSLQVAESGVDANASDSVTKALFDPLQTINGEAAELNEIANNILANGAEMKPSDILMLTVKSQEFMFHSQLTANVANRSADGIQQLFRQQS